MSYNKPMKLTHHYRERFKKTLSFHKGSAVGFRRDEIHLPQGKTGIREYLTHPGAVGVLAFPKPNTILLVKQYRYPVHEFTLEIPAGKLAKGENPLACVKRELEEETGYRAGKIRKITAYWPTAAFSDELIHLYIAHDLKMAESHPDEDEFLEVIHMPVAQMEKMIGTGQIRDSKTLIAFLSWKAFH